MVHVEQFRRKSSRVLELWPSLVTMADWLCDAWREPDRGIWEIRSEPRHNVSSKLNCWYALDRMAELARARNPLDLDAIRWHATSKQILAWLDEHGKAADGGLRADPSSADLADGYLVQVVWRNPWVGDERIAHATVDRMIKTLGTGPFMYRYTDRLPDGLPPGEGAFLPVSFWTVEALARLGRWEEAHERMEALCRFAAPLGILPEEADPETGDFLGNMPQALSHLTLIQAALALQAGPR
jgi:GH15 family glucan-1,4-alpha-glucosidase